MSFVVYHFIHVYIPSHLFEQYSNGFSTPQATRLEPRSTRLDPGPRWLRPRWFVRWNEAWKRSRRRWRTCGTSSASEVGCVGERRRTAENLLTPEVVFWGEEK